MSERSKVAVIRCDSYAEEQVEAAIRRGLELLGGVRAFIRPQEPVLLKPNLLAPDPPAKCTTTHPAVFRAVARIFQAAGSPVSWGDSPAAGAMLHTAKAAGLATVAQELGLVAADFATPVEVSFPDGRQNKKFLLAKGVIEHAGMIVNLPKLKTHALVRFTGAVKNLFGCIPGLLKAEYHVKLIDPRDFARMLVDLNLLLKNKVRLHILDGIQAMEGNGPRGGTPFPMHVLLLSGDSVALDATAAKLAGMAPDLPPTTQYGMEFGLGTFREAEIQLLGDPLPETAAKRFTAVRDPVPQREPGGIVRLIKQWLIPRPVIQANRCTRCGNCVKMCPVKPKALDWRRGHELPPVYEYGRCIRCYCCQELCPEQAIKIYRPLLGRWIRRA